MKDDGFQFDSGSPPPPPPPQKPLFHPAQPSERPLDWNKELQKQLTPALFVLVTLPRVLSQGQRAKARTFRGCGKGGGRRRGNSSCVFSHSVTGVLAPLEDMCSPRAPLSSTHSLWLGPAPSAKPLRQTPPPPWHRLLQAAARAKSPPEGRAFR